MFEEGVRLSGSLALLRGIPGACLVLGMLVIWHGITRTDHHDSPRLVRELCPLWSYRLSLIVIGLGLILLEVYLTPEWYSWIIPNR